MSASVVLNQRPNPGQIFRDLADGERACTAASVSAIGPSELPSSFIYATHRPRRPSVPSITSSASSSPSSVFSADAASSQSSQSSSLSSSSTSSLHVVWEVENANPSLHGHDAYYSSAVRTQTVLRPGQSSSPDAVTICSRPKFAGVKTDAIPIADTRVNPRRTNRVNSYDACPTTTCSRPPPSLLRQSERKVNFVDNLVDSAAQIVEVIWPLSAPVHRHAAATGNRGVLSLRTFIQETLRRSRTSYSTLQVALYYLILIKPHVPEFDFTMQQPDDCAASRALQCGRRMFLAALILASKYLQDRNYSSRAWSKISGLNTQEINLNEMSFLSAINWRLHISEAVFQRWTDIVLKYTSSPAPSSPSASPLSASHVKSGWASIVPSLTAELLEDDISPMDSELDTPVSYFDFNQSNEIQPYPIPSLEPWQAEYQACDAPSKSLYNLSQFSEGQAGTDNPLVRALPPSIRPGPLPTPQMTPRSNGFGTPAVGADSSCLRRSSISCAMAQVQSACNARTTMDRWPATKGTSQRRRKLVRAEPFHGRHVESAVATKGRPLASCVARSSSSRESSVGPAERCSLQAWVRGYLDGADSTAPVEMQRLSDTRTR